MNGLYGFVCGMVVTLLVIALTLMAIGPPPRFAAREAERLCKETGGEMLVTEFNTETGLTLNCFYPGTLDAPVDGAHDL